jgi:hypothetical protein
MWLGVKAKVFHGCVRGNGSLLDKTLHQLYFPLWWRTIDSDGFRIVFLCLEGGEERRGGRFGRRHGIRTLRLSGGLRPFAGLQSWVRIRSLPHFRDRQTVFFLCILNAMSGIQNHSVYMYCLPKNKRVIILLLSSFLTLKLWATCLILAFLLLPDQLLDKPGPSVAHDN